MAIFLPRLRWWGWAARWDEPSILVVWLYRWLLFRLMFESGIVKWISGDPTWRHFSALDVYYETQPLPNPLSWAAQHLPTGFHHFCVAAVFGIEWLAPFLIFSPRRFRWAAFAAFVFLQVLILTTGNYGFFNLLVLVLAFLLLDDEALPAWRPEHRPSDSESTVKRAPLGRAVRLWVALLAVWIGSVQVFMTVGGRPPAILAFPVGWFESFRIVNTYGLFAVMTTTRPEIIIEGSNDGQTWLPYVFRYKVQDLNRRPRQVAPYQPRLDWQMWFAALGTYDQNRWFISFCVRLLQGSKPVLDLLASNPFPTHPPRYIRAQLFQYHFSSEEEHRASGAWWTRTYLGAYCPPFSLQAKAS